MSPTSNDPERLGLEILARVVLHYVENDPSLIQRSSRTIRNRRTIVRSEALPAVLGERPSEPPSAPVIVPPINIAAAHVVMPDWAPNSAELDDACDVKSPHFQPWATARPSRVWRSSPVVRYTLPAAFVVAVCVALLGKMLSHPGSQPTNTLTIAEQAGAPMLAPNEAKPHRDALAAANVPTVTPNTTSP